MTRRAPNTVSESAELDEVFARLRATGGPALAEGQVTCCYALTKGSLLLRILDKLLKLTR
jgi:hypothetical protein